MSEVIAEVTTQVIVLPTDQPPDASMGDDALVVRVLATADWARRLPRAPTKRVVTVTVSHTTALASGQERELTRRGYRLAGTVDAGPRPAGQDVADVLVPRALAAEEPAWWSALVACAHRSFSLAHGPVRLALRELIRAHEAARSA